MHAHHLLLQQLGVLHGVHDLGDRVHVPPQIEPTGAEYGCEREGGVDEEAMVWISRLARGAWGQEGEGPVEGRRDALHLPC